MPITNLVTEFQDIGNIFTPTTIISGETKKVLVVFEVDSSSIKNEYILKIKRNMNGDAAIYDSQYKDVIIKPVNLDKEEENNYYDVPSVINFNESTLGDITLNIDSIELKESFKETDKYCLKNDCYDKTIIMKPTSSEKIIMKIKASMINNSEIKYANSISQILETFGEVCYSENGIVKCSKVNINATKHSQSDYIYLDVTEKLNNSEEKHLILTIRNKKYVISLN